MNRDWTMNDYDKTAVQELSLFLPDRIYDIHSHVYRVYDLNLTTSNIWSKGPQEVSIQVWKNDVSRFLGRSRLLGGLHFPAPTPLADLNQANLYLSEQLDGELFSRGLIAIKPDDQPENITCLLEHRQMVGFKPYHLYSTEKPSMDSSIAGFCPEWMWKMADERGMIVMLHLVKDLAIADPENVREIRDICMRYPHVKLVLAHAARCFHGPHKKGIKALSDLDNVWFDTSAICESEALVEILRQFGSGKLLWGSDFPISQIRGKAVTVGDGFIWLTSELMDWDKHALVHPVLVGIESLRALRDASDQLGLNDQDINDVFYGNALGLLDLKDEHSP